MKGKSCPWISSPPLYTNGNAVRLIVRHPAIAEHRLAKLMELAPVNHRPQYESHGAIYDEGLHPLVHPSPSYKRLRFVQIENGIGECSKTRVSKLVPKREVVRNFLSRDR